MADADASRRVKIWKIDGAACFPLFLFLLYPRLPTFLFLCGVIIMLTIISRRGFPVSALLRSLRSSLAANPRRIRSAWRQIPGRVLVIAFFAMSFAFPLQVVGELYIRHPNGVEEGCPPAVGQQTSGYVAETPSTIAAPMPRVVAPRRVPRINYNQIEVPRHYNPRGAPEAVDYAYADPVDLAAPAPPKSYVLRTTETVQQNIDRWAAEEGYYVEWFPPLPPMRPTQEVTFPGPLLGAEGPLETVLKRISPRAERIARAYRNERKIIILPPQDEPARPLPGFTAEPR